jgi:hypothetical protein
MDFPDVTSRPSAAPLGSRAQIQKMKEVGRFDFALLFPSRSTSLKSTGAGAVPPARASSPLFFFFLNWFEHPHERKSDERVVTVSNLT